MDNTPPKIGDTVKGYCKCADKDTTWSLGKILFGSATPHPTYKYFWTCLSCGKRTWIDE
jgi:hypothetical protein